jgi:N-methylhydantoinase A
MLGFLSQVIEMSDYAIAVDIGGTFTDFVLQDRQKRTIVTEKVLTTPAHPEQAILQGLDLLARRSGLRLDRADLFLHATTIITNAVIERKGHDFIFIHTAGFRDVLETGREHRYNLTNLRLRFPAPLARPDLKLAVQERVGSDGTILQPPDRTKFLADFHTLVDATGITNFAVCFLHAYRNQANETTISRWIAEAYPQAHISTSAAVAPAQREYERWMTCAVNAYTTPLLAEYIGRLQRGFAESGFMGRALMMTSSGFALAFEACKRYPVRLIESGPAAGVLAAREIAARNGGTPDVLAYDMGGTTAKGAFLTAGAVHVQSSLEVARVGAFERGSGFPLMIPAVDLIEIGAGGGSIATVDDRGVISVGPQSAGADPGPACYGRGGSAATLTDATLALGLLSEENFSHSGIEVRRTRALQAIENTIADRLGISVPRAATGIYNTINENVARAFRVHAAELGIDYRRYALVCTGGSSPLHAVAIAALLHIKKVIFPFGAGVSSAFGLFVGPEGFSLQRTNRIALDLIDEATIATRIAAMLAAEPTAASLAARGAAASLTLGMRYHGQGYEIAVALGADPANHHPTTIRAKFETEYRRIFGLVFPSFAIEINNWTLDVSNREPLAEITGYAYENTRHASDPRRGTRTVLLGEAAAVPVYDRYALAPGQTISGPALIEENDTTIYLPPSTTARVQKSLDLIAELES